MFGIMVYFQNAKKVKFDNEPSLGGLQTSNVLDAQNRLINSGALPTTRKVTLLAVGDIMMHQSQLDASYNKKTNTYDFSKFFVNIKPYLKDADIVYANLETPVAGKDLKYSGYPKFNAPTEILDEMKSNYFTHVSLANNHTLDRGVAGLINTIKNVEEVGLVGFGTREGTSTNYKITEKNGLKIGFLSYTYDTNGLTLPKGKAGMISYINKEQIVKDISDLKKQNVDVVTIALHFGIEYKLQENSAQRDLAQLACNSGADIILGDHPHVLQPIVFLNDKISASNRKCLAIYSLGNFISGMSNPYTDLGGILKVEIEKKAVVGGGAGGGESGVDNSGIVDNRGINEGVNSEGETLSLTPSFFATWVKRGTDKTGSKYYTVLPLDADKIPADINITDTEKKRLDTYRSFVDLKIKVW